MGGRIELVSSPGLTRFTLVLAADPAPRQVGASAESEPAGRA